MSLATGYGMEQTNPKIVVFQSS